MKMIRKVLIAEDIDSINMGLVSLLQKTFKFEVDHTKYCDEAYLKIKKSWQDNSPYDLLITDLSFKEDHRKASISNGSELIKKIKDDGITIKCIIYSVEDRPLKIRSYYKDLEINGYVSKGRNSSEHLTEAIQSLCTGEDYLPGDINLQDGERMVMEIEDYDLILISKLAKGNSQEEIREFFIEQGIKPNSLSSIEKRINKLKLYFKAKNTIHLVAITKDLGLI